jgi:hypothetical protein
VKATRKSLRQTIADLEARNSLNKQDADALRTAPRWSFTGAEITGYLGAGIITVGVAWIIIAIAQDLNRVTIYFALYLAGAIILAIARWLRPRGVRSRQVAELLFGLGVGSLAGAVGLTLYDLGLRGPVATAIASALALGVGLATCRRTLFIGTLLVIAATILLMSSIGESFHLSESVFPLTFIVSGVLLVVLGFQRVGSAFLARIAGSVSLVMGSVSFAAMQENNFRPIVSIVICASLFYIGARHVNLEFIVGGGAGITIAIGILAGRIFDALVMQGAVVTATGVAIAALSFVIVRRRDASSS